METSRGRGGWVDQRPVPSDGYGRTCRRGLIAGHQLDDALGLLTSLDGERPGRLGGCQPCGPSTPVLL